MDTQEAQTIINNSKDTESDKYKEAKAFLESQQVKGKTEKELKAEEKNMYYLIEQTLKPVTKEEYRKMYKEYYAVYRSTRNYEDAEEYYYENGGE